MSDTRDPRRVGIGFLLFLVLALLFLPACGHDHDRVETRIAVVQVLSVGYPVTDIVAYPEFNFYAAAVVPGAFYKISITGLSDDADLLVFGADGTYSYLAQCSIDNTVYAGTTPEDCVIRAQDSTLYFGVDGAYLAGWTGVYTISIETVATSNATLSVPQGDSLGRREARIYAVPAPLPGYYAVSITGLSDDADLYVFGTDAFLSIPAVCLIDNTQRPGTAPEDCTFSSAGGMLYFVVDGLFSSAPAVSYTVLAAPAVP